jgi:glycerol-3-phosphate dehydrogenase (NAD(P)+)
MAGANVETPPHLMRIGVIGGGSWGTALARLLAEAEHDVALWFHNPEVERQAREARENKAYLPGFPFPTRLVTTTSIETATAGSDLLVAACPSHVMREILAQAATFRRPECLVVSASKGIEGGSLKRMTEVLVDVFGQDASGRIGTLSGPSFAREVAAGMPTAVTVAAPDERAVEAMQHALSSPAFRVYSSTDVVGVELGGAAKNVIAIAAGMADGLGFGSSTRAALITRGVAEVARLATKLGGDPRTASGLSGVGDLVLTCTGDLSRNRTVGLRLGRGESLEQILADMKMVAEGVKNSETVAALAQRAGVEMPITEQMRQLLHEGKPPLRVVGDLMSRQVKAEFWS